MTDYYFTPNSGGRVPDPLFFEGGSSMVPAPVTQKRPKARIDLAARKRICHYAELHPDMRQADVAAVFNVERSTVSKILKQKQKWLSMDDNDAAPVRSPASAPSSVPSGPLRGTGKRSPGSQKSPASASVPSPQAVGSPLVGSNAGALYSHPTSDARGLPGSSLGLSLAPATQ